MELNTNKMTCINCCCSVTNMERNNTENLNLFLISVFGNVLHSKSTVLNDITICNNCNSYANKLWNYRNNFLKQTNPESRITRITEQDGKVKKFFGLDKNVEVSNAIKEFITCDSETPFQSQNEIIVPKTESNSYEQGLSLESAKHEVEDIVKGEVVEIVSDIYDEKILELKIPKLQLSELHPKSLPKVVNPVHSCEKCSRNFASQEKLLSHLQSAHTNVGFNFSCHFCEKSFSYYWFYKNHLKVNHCGVEMTFSCSICRKVVHSQKELDQHNFSAHQITSHPFKCNFCDVAFETVEEIGKLRSHLVETHVESKEAEAARVNLAFIMENQSWNRKTGKPCDFCGKPAKDRLSRTVHFLFEHQDHRYCQTCNEIFDSEDDFYDHIQQSGHPLDTCAVCAIRLSSPEKLLSHWQNTHMVKCFRFSCEICGSSFRNFEQLKSHYKYHSVKASPRQFSCNQCGKLFMLKHQLKHHMTFHSLKSKAETDELIKCKYCEKTFKGSRGNICLRKHIYNWHTEELKKETDLTFKCLEPECDLIFLTARSLHLHKRRHSYNISEISKTIKSDQVDQSSTSLIKPLVKDGVKKFQCGLCEVMVATKDHLHRHLFRKHDLKFDSIKYDTIESVKCEVCGKTYKDKYKLKSHMAALHIEKPKPIPINGDQSSKNLINMVIKDGVRKYKCGLCETMVTRMDHLHRHLFCLHGVKFSSIKYDTFDNIKCDVCGKSLRDKYRLKKHMATFHKGKPDPGDRNYLQQYKCTLCDAICIATYGIRNHFLSSHPNTPGANAAVNNIKRMKEDNVMGLRSNWNLVQNDSIAKAENYCQPCNNLFPTISDKYAHDCQFHETLLQCKICKEEFGSEENLKKHQSSHSSLNCHHCISVFDCVEDYHEHLLTKHTLQPYICEFCGLFFSTKTRIRTHYRDHSNKQPATGSSNNKTGAKYGVCGKSYRDKNGLKSHMAAIHGGATTPTPGLLQNDESSESVINEVIKDSIKKFQCGLCQIVMSRKYHLHRHLFRKHAVKFESLKYGSVENVKCEICCKILIGKYQLKNHMAAVHQVNLVSAKKQNNLKSQPIGSNTRCSSRIRQKKPIAYCSTESDSSGSESTFSDHST